MDKRMLRRISVIVMVLICLVSLLLTPVWTKADNVNAIAVMQRMLLMLSIQQMMA